MPVTYRKPTPSTVRLGHLDARRHLSLDGHTPLCGSDALDRYRRARGEKANCKRCAELVRELNRRLARKLVS